MNPKFCFVACTINLTDQGLKAIETLKIGDSVLSMNTNTMEEGFKNIIGLSTNSLKN